MISFPLWKRNFISTLKLFFIFLAILIMYSSIIIYMFDPKLADMLNDYQEALPEMMAAVGMTGVCDTLLEFIHTYLYGFIMLLIPVIFTIIITNKLVMHYVDNGSMACLLSTPNTRRKIIITQCTTIILSILCLIFLTATISYFCCEVMFPGELDSRKFVLLNISTFLLQFAIGGIAFFSACFFNESKGFFVVGAGLPLVFYIIQMLANMGGDLAKLKYITIFTLFPGELILSSSAGIITRNLALGGIGISLYLGGIYYFTKKDLPL